MATLTFSAFAIEIPSLLLAPFSKPFIFVILAILLLLAVGAGVVMGSIGGVMGRWLPSVPRSARIP